MALLGKAMKAIAVFIGAVLLLWGLRWIYTQGVGSDEIEYRGSKIKLTRKYIDYDAYKNDSDNILASELPSVEKMMTEVKIGPRFKDWTAFSDESFKIKFPGYGYGGGPQIEAEGRDVVVIPVEIPARPPVEKNRYFVVEKLPDGGVVLLDDFVSSARFARVRLSEGQLIYLGPANAIVRETKL